MSEIEVPGHDVAGAKGPPSGDLRHNYDCGIVGGRWPHRASVHVDHNSARLRACREEFYNHVAGLQGRVEALQLRIAEVNFELYELTGEIHEGAGQESDLSQI